MSEIIAKSHLKDFTHTDYQNKDNMLARGKSIGERFYNENELQNIILKEGGFVFSIVILLMVLY